MFSSVLPLVIYGRETRFLILRKEHRLRVYENRVLRRIFGSKDEITWDWRSRIATRSLIKKNEMDGECITNGGFGGETLGKATIWKT